MADPIARHAPQTLLLAAGGIADGRGLAASRVLGADGVLVGTRLWASREALVHEGHHRAVLETDGDGTVRTTVADIARQIAWPRGFTARIRRNAFTERWHGREVELEREAAGLIDAIEPAAAIVERMVDEAVLRLQRYGGATLTADPATSASQAPR